MKRIRHIRLLMIFSHLLLTIFVVQWLAERYQQEQVTLRKELLLDFQNAEQKMLDSVIVSKFINPLLKTESRKSIQFKIDTLSTMHNHCIVSTLEKKTSTGKPKFHAAKDSNFIKIEVKSTAKGLERNGIIDSTLTQSEFTFKSIGSPIHPDKLLLQGVKLFVQKFQDSTGNERQSVFAFSSGFDTSVLKESFEKQLSIKNFGYKWIDSIGNDSLSLSKLPFFYSSSTFNGNLGVEVRNYHTYVIGRIAPNIIFGILLLFLTGAAFVISFLSLKKQMQYNVMRNEFVSNITHELKTPVATVKVALEALQSFNVKGDTARANEYISIAAHELNRLDLLIHKVLMSSVYENEKSIMQFEAIYLKDAVEEVIQSLQIRINQANAQVSLVEFQIECEILADKLHLYGVINNLIDNSLKYTEQPPVISIRLHKHERWAVLTFTDNGFGIPKEYIGKVFDKFFRVPTHNRHNIKGYGLGLSYATMVMKQHKGTIEVTNNEAIGCTFTLKFPLLKK